MIQKVILDGFVSIRTSGDRELECDLQGCITSIGIVDVMKPFRSCSSTRYLESTVLRWRCRLFYWESASTYRMELPKFHVARPIHFARRDHDKSAISNQHLITVTRKCLLHILPSLYPRIHHPPPYFSIRPGQGPLYAKKLPFSANIISSQPSTNPTPSRQ